MPAGSARDLGSQVVQYIRKRIQVTDPGLLAGYKIGRLPARAYILIIDVQVVAAFNSTSTDTIQLGTTAAGVDILAATSTHATGFTHATTAAGLGLAVTGTVGTDVDIYARWVSGGGTPNAGDVTVIIAFITDHDG
jgi:hypothetical protein